MRPPVLSAARGTGDRPAVVIRQDGDGALLVEYGPPVLDLGLRFRVHALTEALAARRLSGILDLTPGIRSLQIHYDDGDARRAKSSSRGSPRSRRPSPPPPTIEVPSRIVHLPLSWDDPATQLAIRKYMQSVRPDAPWCPSNIEFIRRINGLDTIDEVRRIVFDASYLVLGLGDVYLGAPVATPLDPRHRLVTTKYNPARTWTPENAVGIGGAYLCVYGMEGPGGYQFVGRTCQMWNRFHETPDFPAGNPGCCASSTRSDSSRSASASFSISGPPFSAAERASRWSRPPSASGSTAPFWRRTNPRSAPSAPASKRPSSPSASAGPPCRPRPKSPTRPRPPVPKRRSRRPGSDPGQRHRQRLGDLRDGRRARSRRRSAGRRGKHEDGDARAGPGGGDGGGAALRPRGARAGRSDAGRPATGRLIRSPPIAATLLSTRRSLSPVSSSAALGP